MTANIKTYNPVCDMCQKNKVVNSYTIYCEKCQKKILDYNRSIVGSELVKRKSDNKYDK